jgi:hypothetical protein
MLKYINLKIIRFLIIIDLTQSLKMSSVPWFRHFFIGIHEKCIKTNCHGRQWTSASKMDEEEHQLCVSSCSIFKSLTTKRTKRTKRTNDEFEIVKNEVVE